MERNGTIEVFFSLASMVNHFVCIPLIRLFRSLYTSLTWGNFNSELIKPTLNTRSETKNSEFNVLEFGNTEFIFELRVFLKLRSEMDPGVP